MLRNFLFKNAPKSNVTYYVSFPLKIGVIPAVDFSE